MGKFGGSDPEPSAYVAANTLRSKTVARLVDVVSEGPIGGLVNGLRSFYLDKVPAVGPSGTQNALGLVLEQRLGYPIQDPLSGITDVESEYQVGVVVKQAVGPVVQSLQNNTCDAVRIKIRLGQFERGDAKGNVYETSVSFAIQYTSTGSGSWRTGYFESAFVPYYSNPTPAATTGIKWRGSVLAPANGQYNLQLFYRPYGTSTWILGATFSGGNSGPAQWLYPVLSVLELPMTQYDVMITETLGNAFGAAQSQLLYHNSNATITISGKTTSGYEEAYRMEIPKSGGPWQIRVLRLTADATDFTGNATSATYTQDEITFSGYTEIIDSRLMYSDTAVYGITIDTQYFSGSGLPTRGYDVFGRIVRVPSNYDANARTYTGVWDGTFKLSWTNNPVWCFLDLLTHERYGAGQWIDDDLCDFSSLYIIAKYCDVMVPDGKGGTEPRFTFNTQITSAQQAYTVLNSLVSVFRGMIYWAAGQVSTTQDAPGPVSRVVTRANVVGGSFSYTGVPLNARHSVCAVTWNDPDDFYNQAVEVVEDPELKARFGYIVTSVQAFGCTSRGQAIRTGRWILDTEKYATDVVTYRAGWDHAEARPGEIIAVSDPAYAGLRQGGRVISATVNSITMDAPYTFSKLETYTMSVVIPTWGRVSCINNGSNVTVIGDRTSFLNAIKPLHVGDVFVFENDATQYTVASVADNEHLTFTAPYAGATRSGANYSVFRGGVLLMSSLIVVIDVEIQASIDGAFVTVPLAANLPMVPNNGVPFVITGTDIAPRLFRIIGNKEVGPDTFEISALEYDPTKYARVETGYQAKTTKKLIDNSTPLDAIETIACKETIYKANNQLRTRLTISWTPLRDGRVTYYQLVYSYNGGPYQLLAGTSDTTYDMVDEVPGDYIFGVRPISSVTASGPFVYKNYTALGKNAPPADVSDFVAIRTVNGTQLNWTAVDDLDVVGYEIREGLSWDSGAIITTEMNGTTEFILLNDTLQHTFFIKALDDTSHYSVNASSVVTAVAAPANVSNFFAVQDNDRVQFNWDKVEGQDIRYEIREGETFAVGRRVALVSGNTANAMYPLEGDRIFWIKALSSVGLYSISASFSEVSLTVVQNRNLVYTSDRAALGWPGANFGVQPGGFGNTELLLQAGAITGSQTFQIILGYAAPIRARIWFDYTFTSDALTPQWGAATFTWGDPQADVAWQPLLDTGAAHVDWYISVNKAGYGPSVIEAWPFDTTLTGDAAGTLPTQGKWVTGQGVPAIGTYVTGTEPSYDITVTNTFTVQLSCVWTASEVYQSPTSYGGVGGSGNRAGTCTVTTTFAVTGATSLLVDGSTSGGLVLTAGQTSGNIVFDFGVGASNFIDEFVWKQDTTAIEGTWTFEGSNDNATYTAIQTAIPLGGALTTTITITPLTKARFRYFRLRMTGGSTSAAPHITEVEFKISNALAATYLDKVLLLAKVTGAGKFMRLLYIRDHTTPRVLLTDGNPGNDLSIDIAGDGQHRCTFAVVQDTSSRSLYMYDWDSTIASQVSNSAPSAGSYNSLAA
ncbi:MULTISPECIES: phage tail protein [unclassified Bradyrhizobium]|uniref:host specificity protein J n=1 Tax=unclassified Bradyrhizobium TaxID=2631580 RepID=UPI003390F714